MIKPYYETELGILYHGDCLEILPQLDKVDLVLTDPPYGIGIAANPFRQKHEKKNWDNIPASPEAIKMMCSIGQSVIIWGGNYFNLSPTQCFLIWDKIQPEAFSSSAVACERLDRRWIGIEISKEYCDIAVKRIEAERSQLKLNL